MSLSLSLSLSLILLIEFIASISPNLKCVNICWTWHNFIRHRSWGLYCHRSRRRNHYLRFIYSNVCHIWPHWRDFLNNKFHRVWRKKWSEIREKKLNSTKIFTGKNMYDDGRKQKETQTFYMAHIIINFFLRCCFPCEKLHVAFGRCMQMKELLLLLLLGLLLLQIFCVAFSEPANIGQRAVWAISCPTCR